MILRYIVALCLLCAIGIPGVMAQEYTSDSKAFYIGIKGAGQVRGIANQNNYGQKEMEYSIPLGLAGGVTLQYKLNARNFIMAELTYSEQGQSYRDNFNGKEFYKRVALNYWNIPVLYKYMVSDVVGYQGVNIARPQWFVLGGIQFSQLNKAEIEWQINDQLTNFITFVSDDGNPNAALIEENGIPKNDMEFFEEFDVVFVTAFGFHSHLNPFVTASVELRGGIGLTDINAEAWRLPNRIGEYGASRTSFLGIHAGIHIRLFEGN